MACDETVLLRPQISEFKSTNLLANLPREGIRAGQIIWLCACEMPKETCADCDVDYAAEGCCGLSLVR